MAFDDNPTIDESSRNSEKSERRLRDFLNQSTGFICRAEIPDKGCDFDTELILEETKSSNWRFSIQLKSIEKLIFVKDQKYISYSFETSRLGYLMRRIPSTGLIVLYSIEEDRCFYEYVDKIYSRLMEVKMSNDWKRNEKVNIHVPYTNVLTEATAQEVHKKFTEIFKQVSLNQNSDGKKSTQPITTIVHRAAKTELSELREYTMSELRGKFTKKELIAMADAQNGIMLLPEWQPNKECFMFGLEDSERFNLTFTRHGADVKKCLEKIDIMTAAQVYFLQDMIDRCWQSPGFDHDRFFKEVA